jgi:predicted NBD/HSP70 family sugar kinase
VVRDLVRDSLSQSGFAVPVTVINDANSEAIAEMRLGVAQHVHSAFVIKLAGGVGAAVVHGGEVLLGARGYAGEMGHVPVAIDSRDDFTAPVTERWCECGRTGCLHELVSVRAVVEQLRPGLADECGNYHDALQILEREADDDLAAAKKLDEVMQQTGAVLGRATSATVATLDPEIVVVRSVYFPRESLAAGIRQELERAMGDCPDVRLGTPGRNGRWMGAQGAALLASDLYVAPRVNARCDQREVPHVDAVGPLPDGVLPSAD